MQMRQGFPLDLLLKLRRAVADMTPDARGQVHQTLPFPVPRGLPRIVSVDRAATLAMFGAEIARQSTKATP